MLHSLAMSHQAATIAVLGETVVQSLAGSVGVSLNTLKYLKTFALSLPCSSWDYG